MTPRGAALQERLAEVIAAARAAWPAIELPSEAVAAYVAERIPDRVEFQAALARMHTSDLYLACGCVLGDPHALAAFERHCLGAIDRALARLGFGGDVVSEVKQRLRHALLVAEHGPPRISVFAGRGDLRRWIRVMAVHEALAIARQARRHPQVPSDALDDARLVGDEDVELGYFKRRYRDELRAAIADALQTIRDRDRLLLKQQFLDELGVNEIARLHRVHRATAARWLDRAHRAMRSATRASLMRRLDVPPTEIDSIVRLVQSQLEISLRRLFGRQRA